MIIGLGTDLVRVDRIEAAIGRWGDRFLYRVFSRSEVEFCRRYQRPGPSLAARFAAKEALIKALRAPAGLAWLQMEVMREEGREPTICLRGEAERVARRLGVIRYHLSLSHEGEYAAATVILEAEGR